MTSLLPSGSQSPRSGAGRHVGALVALSVGLMLSAPAAAQVVIGSAGGPRPAVVVDLGALSGLPAAGAPTTLPGLRYGPIPPPSPDFVPPSELYLPLAVVPPPVRPSVVAPVAPVAPGVPGVPPPEINLPTAAAPPAAVLPGPGQPVSGTPPPVLALPAPAPSSPAPAPVAPSPAPAVVERPQPEEADPAPTLTQPAPELSVPALVPDIPPPPTRVPAPPPVAALPTPEAPAPTPMPAPSPPPDTPDLGDLAPVDQPEILQERPPAPAGEATEPQIQTVDPQDTQTAALDPDATVEALDENAFRIRFATGSSDPGGVAEALLASVADRMSGDANVRLEIKAYAGTGTGTPGDARRLSLRRALAIRTFLVDRGIESTRIDVKALGDTAPDSPADRVDLLLSG